MIELRRYFGVQRLQMRMRRWNKVGGLGRSGNTNLENQGQQTNQSQWLHVPIVRRFLTQNPPLSYRTTIAITSFPRTYATARALAWRLVQSLGTKL
jgi:hypothetical protein